MKHVFTVTLLVIVVASCDRRDALSPVSKVNATVTAGNNAWYVSTTGSSSNDGSHADPWDLRYALEEGANGSIVAGDTVYLLAGLYSGHFTTTLSGQSATSRITFRNLPGDRVILDDAISGCPGGQDSPAHIKVEGSWLVFQGLELTNSEPTRVTSEACHGFRPQPIYNKGNNNSYINLVMHDGGHFYSDWTASGVEVIGCIIYNNGWDREAGDVNSDGHGLYLKSSTGITAKGNVIFNDFAFGIHAYTEPGEAINNIVLVGNIAFNNGTLSDNVGSSNILLGGKVPATGGVVDSNFTYFSPEDPGIQMAPNVRVGWQNFPNNSISLRGNYFVGKGSGLANVVDVGYWTTNNASGNAFVGCKPPPYGICEGILVTLRQPDPPGTGYQGYLWSGNTHQRDYGSLSWQYTSGQGSLVTTNFNNWRQTVRAQDNAIGGLPTAARIFVRANGWEQGRGTIAVYNWQNQTSVSVNLSNVVPIGWTYRIQNVQDLFNPTPVALPISAILNPPDPIGVEPHSPRLTGTAFNAYLVTSSP